MNKYLKEILIGYKKSPNIYQPSKFWQVLNQKHFDKLAKDGYENFKETVNLNYFYFNVGIRTKYFSRHLLNLLRWSDPVAVFRTFAAMRFENPPRRIFAKKRWVWLYKLFMALLIQAVRTKDKFDLFDLLEEPKEGNPFRLHLGDKKLISQDICNSLLEFYSLQGGMGFGLEDRIRIAELGGGCGRVAFVFLSALKNVKYVMIDIPPALYIAWRYLSSVFINKKIFKYRDFHSYDEIRNEYEQADIIFLLPHQLEFLPPRSFDLFINISSFGEMRKDQIDNYFGLIDKLCSGFFYNKQWKQSVNAPDNIVIDFDEYPIRDHWKKTFKRQALIQTHFMEAMYKLSGNYE